MINRLGGAEFGYIRDQVELSDSALSKQLKILDENGFLTTRRKVVQTRPRSWIELSEYGRSRLESHVNYLIEVSGVVGSSS